MRRNWCAAQELEPFGWRVEKRFWTRNGAWRYVRRSRYLYVRHIDWVTRRNKDLERDEVFWPVLEQVNERLQRRKGRA